MQEWQGAGLGVEEACGSFRNFVWSQGPDPRVEECGNVRQESWVVDRLLTEPEGQAKEFGALLNLNMSPKCPSKVANCGNVGLVW